MNQLNAFKIISDVKKISESLLLSYWLNLGTVLGLYRDGKFIDLPGEDIDIGLLYTPEVLTLPQHLKKAGFNIQAVRSFHDVFFHISTNRDDIHVCFDIYHPYPENKFFLYTETICYYFFHPFNLYVFDDTITYKDVSFNAPDPIIPYLEFQYGPDWRVPRVNVGPAHMCHTKESVIIKEGAKL